MMPWLELWFRIDFLERFDYHGSSTKISVKITAKVFYYVKLFDFDNTLIDKISDENILLCNISYKTLIGAKPLCIRLEKVDGFIRADDGTRYFIILIKSVFNKKQNHYYYNVLLENCLYQLAEKIIVRRTRNKFF